MARTVAPSSKTTWPPGVATSEVTVAVSATGWPKTDGLGSTVSATRGVAWSTSWVTSGEAEGRKSALPG